MKGLKNKFLMLFLILFIKCYHSPAFLIENTVLNKSYKVTFNTPILFKNEYSYLKNKFVNTIYYYNKEKDIDLRINIMVDDDIRIDKSSLYIHYLYSQSEKKLKLYLNNRGDMELLTLEKYVVDNMEISSIKYLWNKHLLKQDCQIKYKNIIYQFVIGGDLKDDNINSIQKIKEKILATIKITNLKNLYNKR